MESEGSGAGAGVVVDDIRDTKDHNTTNNNDQEEADVGTVFQE